MDINCTTKELEMYNEELLFKPRVIAITKCDLIDDEMKEMIVPELPEKIPHIFHQNTQDSFHKKNPGGWVSFLAGRLVTMGTSMSMLQSAGNTKGHRRRVAHRV